ncbi:MAG: hypothetical protein ACQCN5_02130 [Candidatus Bathyarchaeia archaeon]
MNHSALLLVGSPRGFKSTSNSLGTYLLSKLEKGGYTTSKQCIQANLHKPQQKTLLLSAVADCDLLILAFPLYIDCLPAPVILALEKIAEQRKTAKIIKPQHLLVIVNNGFPEAYQNATAIAICHQFADEAGFLWAGGLSLGGGGAINGASLEKAGYLARNIRKSLDITAKNLLSEMPVSEVAVQLMAKPVIAKAFYVFAGNRGWKSMAKQHGTEKTLYDKPFEN